MKMTTKQILFCQYYIENGFNGLQAAIKAGYSKKSANAQAYENLNKPYIKNHIQEKIKAMLSDSEQITLEWLQNVLRIAKSDIRKIAEFDDDHVNLKSSKKIDNDTAYAISEVSQTTNTTGTNISVKLESKTKALELLGKYLAILGNDGPAVKQSKSEKMDAEARRERLAYLLEKKDK